MNRFLPSAFLFEKKDPQLTFQQTFPDFDGLLHSVLHRMKIESNERTAWMKWWLSMTIKDDDHRVDLAAFRLNFRLDSSIWIERLFEIMNYDLSGRASFAEFLEFCSRYILVDKISTVELCFRLLSRRGTNFMIDFSVLDSDDIETYLHERYTIGQPVKLKKMAEDVLRAIENCAGLVDNSGAIMFGDFIKFCEVNPVFVRFTHRIQIHLRNALFGLPYWIERSRKVKSTLNVGSSSMMMRKSNSVSESYLSVELCENESEISCSSNIRLENTRLSLLQDSKTDEFLCEEESPDSTGSARADRMDHFYSIFGSRQSVLIPVGMLVTTRLANIDRFFFFLNGCVSPKKFRMIRFKSHNRSTYALMISTLCCAIT